MYFVHAEDLVAVLVGPFPSKIEAVTHINFCTRRGDGAEMRVIDEATAGETRFADLDRVTPESDRAMDVDAIVEGLEVNDAAD